MPDHLARLGPFYGDRCDALAAALERSLGGQAAFDLPDGGMFLWVRLTDATISARDLLPRAIAAGVAFVPGEAFHVDGSGDDHLRLSFATLRPEELAEAAGRLATALA
jgi:2-aminoadipate transaminase